MNKPELINVVAEKANVTKKVAAGVINAVFDSILESNAKGDAVKIVGFGTFDVRTRAARMGVHPRKAKDKVRIKIPEKKVPVFRPGKELRTSVAKG